MFARLCCQYSNLDTGRAHPEGYVLRGSLFPFEVARQRLHSKQAGVASSIARESRY